MAGQVRQEELLSKEGRKEGFVESVRRPTCGRGPSVEDAKWGLPAGLHGKHLLAMSTRNVRYVSASSLSCEGEDQMLACKAQLAKDTEIVRVSRRSQELWK